MPVRNIAVRCLSLAVPTGIGKMTEFVTFACNICGTGNTMPRDQLERDTKFLLGMRLHHASARNDSYIVYGVIW